MIIKPAIIVITKNIQSARAPAADGKPTARGIMKLRGESV
jgi:hypothetical protein